MANGNLIDLLVEFNSRLKQDYGSKTRKRKNSNTKDGSFDIASTLPLVVMLKCRGICILPNGLAVLSWRMNIWIWRARVIKDRCFKKVGQHEHTPQWHWQPFLELEAGILQKKCLHSCQISATQNRPNIRYLKPIEYLWALFALHTALDVIGAKPEVRDNHLGPTILNIPSSFCWSNSAFGALSNPSNALEVGGCMLGMKFITRSMGDPCNVPLWYEVPATDALAIFKWVVMDRVCTWGYEKLTLLGLWELPSSHGRRSSFCFVLLKISLPSKCGIRVVATSTLGS